MICSFYKKVSENKAPAGGLYMPSTEALPVKFGLILPSIILSVYFKVTLRMITYGTNIGSLCAY